MAELARLDGRLIRLSRREYEHSLLIGELSQTARVHRTAPRVVRFERLARAARIEHEDDPAGVDRFERRLDLLVGDRRREQRLRRIAGDTHAEIARDEIEMRFVGRSVSRVVHEDRVLWLDASEL